MATYKSIAYSPISGGGAEVLLETQTASCDATLSFTSGIDSTYKEYIFKFINIHGETDDQNFAWQCNVAGGSGYNETITSSSFFCQFAEDGSANDVAYTTFGDQANGTAFQRLNHTNAANDESLSGYLHIFNPSSATFVKHFMSRTSSVEETPMIFDYFAAGFVNTTTAIDEFQFKFSSGDIDLGTIKLYGVN